MEKDFEVIGATGIEDKLQEKVVETIRAVQKAGIIPWMLTGDKKETAMNLAQAAGLLPSLNKVKEFFFLSILPIYHLFTSFSQRSLIFVPRGSVRCSNW